MYAKSNIKKRLAFRFGIHCLSRSISATRGSVVTKDGEIIGTWEMDENGHPSFTPNGASEPLFFDVFVGLLCKSIDEWHEANTGDATPG